MTQNKWISITLGAACKLSTGKTPSKKRLSSFGGDIPFVKPGDLDKGIFITRTEETLSQQGLEEAPALSKDTVLVSCIGNLGKKAILNCLGSCNQQINAILPSPYVDSKFIYYYIDIIRPWMIRNASATTVTILNKGKFSEAPLVLPPLAEQKRIVKKIEELFGVIDEQVKRLEATQEALISYRQSILSDCLKNATGISTTLGKIVKPRRERVSFDGTNGHIIFIGMDCIEPNALKPHKTDLLENTKSTCFVFHKDDVLYGRMRSYLNKVFKAETNGAASAEFIVFPPTDTILSDYLKYLLHQQDFVSFATRNASGDRPRVKFEEDLAPFPFTLPSLPEQKTIVKKIETAFAFADKAQAAITNALEQAKQLKQSILKRAFEGKLVPQDPNDKPIDLTQLQKDKQK